MNMEGQITSTASQNIYLSDSQTISQVLVKEGVGGNERWRHC